PKSDRGEHRERPRSSAGYVLAFTSSSAHALATPALGVLSPRGVAQPPSSTNCRCLHESIFRNSACFVAALGCCMKLATQEGVSATTTAELARSTATRSAVLPRTHPRSEERRVGKDGSQPRTMRRHR